MHQKNNNKKKHCYIPMSAIHKMFYILTKKLQLSCPTVSDYVEWNFCLVLYNACPSSGEHRA